MGNAVFETEGHDRDDQGIVLLVVDENADQFFPQFPHQQAGCVKDIVRLGFDLSEDLALLADAVLHASLRFAGVGAAGLLVALDQGVVARVHEQDLVVVPSLTKRRQHLLHIDKGAVRPHIESQDHLVHVAAGHKDQLHEFVDQADRQVIDTVISAILENLDGRRFSAAAHSGHYDKTHTSASIRFFRSLPGRSLPVPA